uniref:Uncharacterized protein n=1 Tax=Rheinheimera sp. BAL341 TaxID=1708203 RepID=A0A486XQE7_9GAMM
MTSYGAGSGHGAARQDNRLLVRAAALKFNPELTSLACFTAI